MKIRLISNINTSLAGDVVNAIISPTNTNQAVYFDSSGSYWTLFNPGIFEVLDEFGDNKEVEEIRKLVVAGGLKTLFGQELQELSVTFK